MKEISAISHRMLQEELAGLKSSREKNSERLELAVKFGDVSESTEYDIAKSEADYIESRIKEIEELLRTVKIKTVYTNTIGPGTLLTVKLSQNGVEEDLGLLMFDAIGDIVLQGKITDTSPLGKAIAGTSGGDFIIQDISGNPIKYTVKVEPEERLVEYLEIYPTSSEARFYKIFSGV